MRFLSLVALGAFALGLSTIGCSADTTDDGAAVAQDEVTILYETVADETDDGKTIKIVEGNPFVFRLKANPTTGYQWKVVKTDRSFAYPASDTFEAASGPDAPLMGSGGTQVLKWNTDPVSDVTGAPPVSKIGKHQVTVEYRRTFEPATTPAVKSITVTIDVVANPNQPNPNDNGGGWTPNELDNDHCGDDACGQGLSCQWCWGAPACIPSGALC